MWNINEEIKYAVKTLDIEVSEIPISETVNIIKSIHNRYVVNSSKTYLWEGFESYISINNKDAWQWVNELIGDFKAIMFFNPSDEKTSFLFNNGSDVVDVLSETYGFEFYLTNISMDYLVCFNHHDMMIACGSAKEWLQKYE